MKAALIQPRGNIYKELPITGINRICEPLGFGYIGAVAKQAGHNIKIIHQLGATDKDVIQETLDFSPDVVGFSIMTFERKKALYLAKEIKGYTDTKIVFGGSDTVGNPEVVLNDVVDFLAVGEGEYSFLDLLDRLERKDNDYNEIPGLVYKNGEQIKINPHQKIKDLDDLLFPLRDNLSMNEYKNFLLSSIPFLEQRFATIINSRGCYHDCDFCLNKSQWDSVKISRSAENVVDEIEYLKQNYNINLIWLWDSNPSKKDLCEISNELLKRNVKIKWQSYLNPGEADISLYQLMHDSWYELCIFGIESGSDKRLTAMHKSTTREKNVKAIKMAKKAGFFVHCTYMVGYPDESKEEFLELFSFLKKMGLDSAVFYFVTPLKGTSFYRRCEQEGLILDENPDHYDLTHPVSKTKLMEEWDKYEDLISWCQKNFYDASWLKRVECSPKRKAYREFIEYLEQRHGPNFHGDKNVI